MKFGLKLTAERKTSRRYALALFNLADEKGVRDIIHTDVTLILRMLRCCSDMEMFCEDSELLPEQREAVFKELFQPRVSELFYDFLHFLSRKERLGILPQVCEAFEDLYHIAAGITRVKIISAQPLSPEQVDAICKRLKSRWNRNVFAQTGADPALIGGFQIRSGDRVLDFSVKSQLDHFRHQVIHSQHVRT